MQVPSTGSTRYRRLSTSSGSVEQYCIGLFHVVPKRNSLGNERVIKGNEFVAPRPRPVLYHSIHYCLEHWATWARPCLGSTILTPPLPTGLRYMRDDTLDASRHIATSCASTMILLWIEWCLEFAAQVTDGRFHIRFPQHKIIYYKNVASKRKNYGMWCQQWKVILCCWKQSFHSEIAGHPLQLLYSSGWNKCRTNLPSINSQVLLSSWDGLFTSIMSNMRN